ncbi:MAG: hypothetical protein ACI4AM_03815 [Muribaculaceae bacterium]
MDQDNQNQCEVSHCPNEETLEAIREAMAGVYEGELDVSSGYAMLKSMGLDDRELVGEEGGHTLR